MPFLLLRQLFGRPVKPKEMTMNPVGKVAASFTLAIGHADALAEQPAVAARPTILERPRPFTSNPEGRVSLPHKDDIVQGRITIFNETQAALDAAFDRKLSICRGC
jgi:hypothetical protein